MGLPNSGKTFFSKNFIDFLYKNTNKNVVWLNADNVRKEFNDWDFSEIGRNRQATRMSTLANLYNFDNSKIVICDFIAPTPTTRALFDPDAVIWMDTINDQIDETPYPDTTALFKPPYEFIDKLYCITEQSNYINHFENICDKFKIL